MKVKVNIDIPSLAEDLYQDNFKSPEYKSGIRSQHIFYMLMIGALSFLFFQLKVELYLWFVLVISSTLGLILIQIKVKSGTRKNFLRSCKKMSNLLQEFELKLSKKQLEIIYVNSDARFDWAAIEELKKAKKHWIIKFEGNTILPVPHKAFKTAKERKQFEAYFKDIKKKNDKSQ